ncbi:MAG: hypothetical protein ACREDY_08945 [Bradyrhizobium sp.]
MIITAILIVTFLAGAMAATILLLRNGIAREESDNSLLARPKTRASAVTRRIVDLKTEAPLR